MKKVKFSSILLTFSCLLSSCNFGSKGSFANTLNTNQKATEIENLPDGNYRYCSQPPSNYDSSLYKNPPDSYRWCFDFHKNNNNIVGSYIYWAPWDTPNICIEGIVNNNQINGVGYELSYGASKPFTEKQLTSNFPKKTKLFIWDDFKSLEGGKNLTAGSPKVHSLGGENNSYYAWILYETAKLDLNGFEPRKSIISEKEVFPSCVPD